MGCEGCTLCTGIAGFSSGSSDHGADATMMPGLLLPTHFKASTPWRNNEIRHRSQKQLIYIEGKSCIAAPHNPRISQ